MIKSFALVILLGFSMAGCGFLGFFKFEKEVDFGRDEGGNPIWLDTQKNWDYWVEFLDREITRELSGNRPQGRNKTWNEYWYLRIEAINDGHHENPGKYTNYIIERRRMFGLPELVRPEAMSK